MCISLLQVCNNNVSASKPIETWNTKQFEEPRFTHCAPMTQYGDIDLVDIGSGNGLLLNNTKIDFSLVKFCGK